MRRSSKLKLPAPQIADFARRAIDEHEALLDDGYRLMGSSGVWRGKAGLTFRFVYRRRDGDGTVRTVTHRGRVALR